MKKILFILSISLFLIGCVKPNRIDHTTNDSIYVWKYSLFNDSILCSYSQPKHYIGIVIKKHKWFSRHPVRCGKMTIWQTIPHYRTTYIINDVEYSEGGSDLYYKVEEGDKIKIIEYFYPMHYKEFNKI